MTDAPAPRPADSGEALPGNVGGATRVGNTVLRPAGPWTPAVHALLDHLAAAGLDGVPQTLRHEGDVEVLTYLPGRVIRPDDELATDAELAGAAGWLRRFHGAVASFRPEGALRWRGSPHPLALADGQIVCHNDPGAYNWIVEDGRFAGMIDWDMAGPGRAIDDLAFLCWSGVPLYRERPADEAARRLGIVTAAYPAFGARELLDAAEARMTLAADRIAAGQARGDAGLLNLARVGEPQRTRDRVAAFRSRRPGIEAALAADREERTQAP